MSRVALVHKLPVNMTGNVIQVKSERQSCAGQWVAIVSREGGFFLGIPWFIEDAEGATVEAKLKNFAWKNLQQTFDPVIEKKPTREGLYKVTLNQTTEHGKIPLSGELSASGDILFFGHFYPLNESFRESRLKSFQPYLDKSPSTGPANAPVTLIEFSDFECPSCGYAHAHGYTQNVLAKFGDQVRYVRFDLPLISMHPWAFSAAVAGRAIWNQKPAAFWEFKEQVYKNQDKLTAFTFDDFARGFAQDHELDLKKYDADIASADLQSTILGGVGAAFSNDVRATPTYLVNGAMVDPGSDGKALENYVAGLLKK
jgi:protein-disulfide isomerase